MKNNLLTSLTLLICSLTAELGAISADKLNEILETSSHPFDYDLHLKILPCEKLDAEILVCMHGMGSDYTLSEIMNSNPALPYHIIAFNFPDYGSVNKDTMKTTFGTFDELAPVFFVLKKFIIDGRADKVHVYGFSAGGGAIVNTLAVLNSTRYDKSLQQFDINEQEKKKIIQSIERGSVILEVPLKSFDEIADLYRRPSMQQLAQRARKNGMTPIDNLIDLQGLSLRCFLYFANPDEAVGNRDDKKFIQLLQNANKKGLTTAIIGKTAGHISYHPELWDAYQKVVDQ